MKGVARMDDNQIREDILTALFSQLVHSPRRQVLTLLMTGEQGPRDLLLDIPVSEPVMYGYLRTLQDAGLIKRRKEGLNSYYSIATPRLRPFLLMALELAEEIRSTRAQQSELNLDVAEELEESET